MFGFKKKMITENKKEVRDLLKEKKIAYVEKIRKNGYTVLASHILLHLDDYSLMEINQMTLGLRRE